MSVVEYLVGVLALVLSVGALSVASFRVRHALVPAWRGAPARLAEVTIGLATLLAVGHALGAVGLFRRWFLTAGCLTVSAGLVAVTSRRRSAPTAAEEEARSLHEPSRGSLVVGSLAVTGVVVTQWVAHTLVAASEGIRDYDSMTYHLPQAARMVQTGWATRLVHANPEFPNMFHPADTEMLHGFGMAFTQLDVLSPWLNLGWLAVALLAGWCIGERWRAGPAALAATAGVLAVPILAETQAGTAGNDIGAIAMLLAAVAFVVRPGEGLGRCALVGAAAGLALGIKLTVLPPIGALVIGCLLVRRSWGAAATRAGTLVATGSIWYLRNLVTSGNPVPALRLGIGPVAFPQRRFAKLDDYGQSLLHYLPDGEVWRDWLLPGLDNALGHAWLLVVAGCLAALVLGAVRGSRDQRFVLAIVAVGLLSYVINPNGAFGPEGQPTFFVINLRYGLPPVVLAAALLPTLPVHRLRQPIVIAAAAVVVLVSGVLTRAPLAGWPTRHRLVAAALVAAVAAAGVIGRRVDPRITRRGVAVTVIALLAIGFVGQRRYVDGRYADDPQLSWLASVEGARIGFAGFDRAYPLYGPELENRVQYVGRRGPHGEFHHLSTCDGWRKALREAEFEYLVYWPSIYPSSPDPAWIERDEALTPIYRVAGLVVFEIDPGAPDVACGEAG